VGSHRDGRGDDPPDAPQWMISWLRAGPASPSRCSTSAPRSTPDKTSGPAPTLSSETEPYLGPLVRGSQLPCCGTSSVFRGFKTSLSMAIRGDAAMKTPARCCASNAYLKTYEPRRAREETSDRLTLACARWLCSWLTRRSDLVRNQSLAPVRVDNTSGSYLPILLLWAIARTPNRWSADMGVRLS
jgi:hypothetical protein